MNRLDHDEITILFLSLGVLLGVARILGETAQWLRQPAVMGELLAGVLLGPTVLGTLYPELQRALFPAPGDNALALSAIGTLSIVLFLLVAGMEVDLSTVWRQGRTALKVGLVGIAIPFVMGLGAAMLAPAFFDRKIEHDTWVFALFVATAMSISALPVIVKTLRDLDLYRTDFGMVVISAAVIDDLFGWTVFAVILGMIGKNPAHGANVPLTVALTLTFVAVMLTAGRWAIHRILPYLQAYTHWPGGTLSFAMMLAFLGAAYTEWIGIHAIFGAFIVGVALGDSPRLSERTRVTIDQFVSFIFAPVFFGSIGLRVNFVTNFDLPLVLGLVGLACACKLIGGTLGAVWGGMSRREAMSVGFAMNARGAMEIILGLLALEAGLISEKLFVAMVVMAIFTSVICGPAIRFFLRPHRERQLYKLLSPRAFTRHLQAQNRRGSIHELTQLAAEATSLSIEVLEQAVWRRENTLPTGIGNGVAIPHARVAGLKGPMVAVGISDAGIDYDAPDALPAHIIFLVLTPIDDHATQLETAAEIARLFQNRELLDQILRTSGFTEFLGVVRAHSIEQGVQSSTRLPQAGTSGT